MNGDQLCPLSAAPIAAPRSSGGTEYAIQAKAKFNATSAETAGTASAKPLATVPNALNVFRKFIGRF